MSKSLSVVRIRPFALLSQLLALTFGNIIKKRYLCLDLKIKGTSINCLLENLEGFLEDIAKQKERAM